MAQPESALARDNDINPPDAAGIAPRPAPARVIVNADDFGLALCVNRGIERARRDGILTSASLIVNMPGFDDAAARAKALPGLGVGVHLNLVRGRPISPASDVPDLVDRRGFFAPGRIFPILGSRRPAARSSDAAMRIARQILTEYGAQIAKARAAGLAPTHVDFEQHHGRYGAAYRCAVLAAGRVGIGAIRSLKEPCWWAWRHGGWPGFRAALRAGLLRCAMTGKGRQPGAKTLGEAERAPAEPGLPTLIHPDYFLGQSWIGAMGANVWRRLLSTPRWPEGVWEVMTHPGEYDSAELSSLAGEIGASWMHPRRPAELAGLVDPGVVAAARDAAAAGRLQFIHFGQLTAAGNLRDGFPNRAGPISKPPPSVH